MDRAVVNSPGPKVRFTCAQCGLGLFMVPGDRSDSSTIVTCRHCGAVIGAVGEIEEAAKSALAGFSGEPSDDDLREAFRKAFSNLKTVRVE